MLVTSTALPHARIRVLYLEDDVERILKLEDISRLVGSGALNIQSKKRPLVSPAMQADPNLDNRTKHAMGVTAEVLAYCKRYSVSPCAAYKATLDKHKGTCGDGPPTRFPSRATVYRYLEAERNGLPLLCGNKNKGNRVPRYTDNVVALIADVAQKQYLQAESRWNIRAITELANLRARDEGLIEGPAISRKFVDRVIFENLATDAELERMDPRERAAQKAIAKGRIRVHGVLQRVEQDALHLPWRIRTPAGDSCNIWLIHSICCATSMPVGWHLVVGAPNGSAGLQCVESILFSKKDRFAELGLDITIDMYGSPGCIAFDNGAEARNDRMTNVTRVGINPQYCKSRHPHHKPFIERLNRSLKEYLQTLPGCTRFDEVDGKRNPEELNDLPMSLLDLERWIVRWYYTVWANRALDRLVRTFFFDDREFGATPKERFAAMNRDGYCMPMPPNRDEWLLVKYEHHERILARTTGITFEGYHFRGAELAGLIERHGDRPVKVLVDRDDYRTVQVVDGARLVPLVNIDVDERTPAYSYSEAKARDASVKGRAVAAAADEVDGFNRDMFAASSEQSPQQARGQKSSSRAMSKQVASATKATAAVDRAVKKPLPVSTTPRSAAGDMSLGNVSPLAVLDRNTGVAV
jgi:putative transposase